jgi:hypothetical protein
MLLIVLVYYIYTTFSIRLNSLSKQNDELSKKCVKLEKYIDEEEEEEEEEEENAKESNESIEAYEKDEKFENYETVDNTTKED